ncbi:unnamed protein product [Brassica napus]|uniref:Box C/D snoRNA protein 1 n=1 Tax=Brassica napus TaxID=3708 RepID=A0A817AJF0_BRANA|nr:unnamed protein product [Brassica napus]
MDDDDKVCGECKSNPWKYKCPGCSIRSCALPCVKAHKKRTGCTGKRKLTDFVPLSKFDDNLLLSDYNLLEETKRVLGLNRDLIPVWFLLLVVYRLCSFPVKKQSSLSSRYSAYVRTKAV